MKKYISLLFAALLATACVEPLESYLGPVINEPEENSKVTIAFSLPPATKGTMAHNPTIETIHVAVFNQAGVLKQYEKAYLTHTNYSLDGNATANPNYAVDLYMSNSPRILHFIADSPVDTYEELVDLAGTSGESVILNALQTEGGATAYWQRYELDKIDAYTYQGGVYTTPDGYTWGTEGGTSYSYDDITVNKGDYIKRDGTKVLDGTGYFQSTYVEETLASIAFVRNFAEITVGSTANSNFKPHSFALVNVPTAGYVAPYDANQGAFASAYQATNLTTEVLSHSTIAGTHYPGMLCGSIDGDMPTSFIDLTSTATGAIKTAYMYERSLPTPSQPATCILVSGEFDADQDGDYTDEDGAVRDGNGLTWFKIEISDENGDYFPVYRGVSYKMQIGLISGTHGYDNPDDALEHDPVGDVSGSVETTTLEQISDGKGTTLWVEYIDWVATGETSKTIYYTMYYYQQGSDTTWLTPSTLSVTHPNADASYKAITSNSITGSQYTGSGTPDDKKRWYVASVPLASVGGNTKQSYLHIEGISHAGKKMYRDVSYRVMGTQHFQNGNNTLKATPLDNEQINKETFLTIYLPSDLGYSMFPLNLKIEAKNGQYTTVDGLPVESGPSLFDASKNAFYFIKTINYDEYHNDETGVTTTAFTTTFKTTRDCTQSGTNATDFRVIDKVQTNRGRTEPYFEVAECSVTVGGPTFFISPENVNVGASATSATFRITSRGEQNPTWTLTPSSNISSITMTTGESSRNITVTFPANNSASVNEYTVTASRTGYDTQTFTITQAAAAFELSASSVTVGPDETSATFDITSTGASTWTLSANNGASVTPTSGSGDASGIIVTFNRNNSASNQTYTVTASREGFPSRTFTVKQQGLSVTLAPSSASVKATETTAIFSINSNSNVATWTISKSNNVTSVTRSNGTSISSGQGNLNDLRVTFPENTSFEQTITYTVTVTLGGVSKDFTITQAARRYVEKSVTFYTNSRDDNFPDGGWFGTDTNAKTLEGVTLDFNNSISSRNNNYLTITSGSPFTVSSVSLIKSITLNYTDNSHGCSGYDGNFSTSNPATQSGTIYAATGTTGTWTGSSYNISFTMYGSTESFLGYQYEVRTQISSIVVNYQVEE